MLVRSWAELSRGRSGRGGEEEAREAVWGEMVEGLVLNPGNLIIQWGPSVT